MKKYIALVMLLVLIITLPMGCKKDDPQSNPTPGQQQPQEQIPEFVEKEILLFYPDIDNNFLLHEFRKVTVEEDTGLEEMVKIVMEQLLKGTANDMLKALVPEDAEILSYELDDGTITIDFSEEFIVSSYNSREELLQIFSVVNTLTELGLEEVNLLVEGDPVMDYYSSIKIDMPFERNDELIPSK